jgi:SAM-dependent methyltransferase
VDNPEWTSEGIDVERPSTARIYDYLLGGCHNFAADREIARQAIAFIPDLPLQAQANRAFMRRAVVHLAAQGVNQFLDIGSGVPTVGNVHEIAQQQDPDARVVYVDIDPIAVAHSKEILAGDPRTAVIEADLRHPDRILAHPDLRAVLDLDRPVGLLMVAVVHFIHDDEEAGQVVARLRDAVAPGSYLVMAHGSHEGRPELVEKLAQLTARTTTPFKPRSRAQVEKLFDGFELIEPGIVWVSEWRPESPEDVDDHPEYANNFGGVGRKV